MNTRKVRIVGSGKPFETHLYWADTGEEITQAVRLEVEIDAEENRHVPLAYITLRVPIEELDLTADAEIETHQEGAPTEITLTLLPDMVIRVVPPEVEA